jgi:hypothetical protein
MTRFAPALLVIFFPLAVGAQDKKDVPPFQSKDGKFTVALPDKPTEQTNKVPTAVGQLEMHMFVIDQKDRAYLVTYSDYPKDSVVDKADKVLDGVVDGNAKALKGKLASQDKITITVGKKDYPGREITVELPDKKGLYKARAFLVGDRLYQVVALGPEDFVKGKGVDEYLKSFKVTE